ncbi:MULTISPECIES: hypothetical protein [unclassified Mycoavidus]|uniref:hypothetical protein n=1 Tax=unclassified Mycoavidus TaxID=2649241 RepID=UPI001CBED8AB|nr:MULTISPECIES: hypothetical protein [unclassified Mycoavidus]UAW64219.1 hypothetical protein KMZ15_00495 [Mycoavidus sp. HKI]UUM21648.1 hypothetical protein NQD60_00530 [Mycoavidus sp. SF9855]
MSLAYEHGLKKRTLPLAARGVGVGLEAGVRAGMLRLKGYEITVKLRESAYG